MTRCLALVLVAAALAAPIGAQEVADNRYALLHELRVDGRVRGDVVALGSDVVLESTAHVGGDVVAVFGSVERAPGAVVKGRTVALTSLAAMLTEGSGVDAARTRVGLRTVTVGFWLVLTTGLAALFPVWCRRGCLRAVREPSRTAVAGVLFVATLVAVIVALLGLGPVLSMPFVTAAVIAAVLAKGVGLALLGGLLGGAIVRLFTPRFVPVSVEVLVGVGLLLALRFVPGVGSALWTALSVVAVGVAAVTVLERPVWLAEGWTLIGSQQTGSADVRPD